MPEHAKMSGVRRAADTISQAGQWLLDLVYVPKCGLCGFTGTPAICTVCESSFEPYDDEIAVLGPSGPLDGVARRFHYRGRAEQAVTRLKYSRVTSLAEPMAAHIESFARALNLLNHDAFVPVPIHVSRRRYRGFNQSSLLCERLPRELVYPGLLKRIRATQPQAGLDPESRRKNLLGAFQADPQAAGKRIVLVDDVLTSGHTAIECAKVLKDAGAIEVVALAFAGG